MVIERNIPRGHLRALLMFMNSEDYTGRGFDALSYEQSAGVSWMVATDGISMLVLKGAAEPDARPVNIGIPEWVVRLAGSKHHRGPLDLYALDDGTYRLANIIFANQPMRVDWRDAVRAYLANKDNGGRQTTWNPRVLEPFVGPLGDVLGVSDLVLHGGRSDTKKYKGALVCWSGEPVGFGLAMPRLTDAAGIVDETLRVGAQAAGSSSRERFDD